MAASLAGLSGLSGLSGLRCLSNSMRHQAA